MRTIIAVAVLSLMAVAVFGSCSYKLESAGSSHCTTSGGRIIPYNHTYKDTANCMTCSCGLASPGSLALQCCGYGIHAGVIAPPPGCRVVAGSDGCSVRLVQAHDVTKDCVPSVVG